MSKALRTAAIVVGAAAAIATGVGVVAGAAGFAAIAATAATVATYAGAVAACRSLPASLAR